MSALDNYLHFEFCGVENFHAWTNFTEAIVPAQLKVWQRRVPQGYYLLLHFFFCRCLKLIIIPLQVWIFYLLVSSKLDFNFIWKGLCLSALLDLLALEAEMFALLQRTNIVWAPDKTNFLWLLLQSDWTLTWRNKTFKDKKINYIFVSIQCLA